ncbi:MAG: hypothetical protein RSB77_02220 [Bacilli bacterium]
MKKKISILLILIISCIFLSSVLGTFAKYVSNSVWNYYLTSKNFYFSSDSLDVTTVKNVNTMWDGGSVYFNIKNSINESLVTDIDISYNVACTINGPASSYLKCELNGTKLDNQNGILSKYESCINYSADSVDVSLFDKSTCEIKGYNWESQVATKSIYFNIISTDKTKEINDIDVSITVKSIEPYEKIMNGNFILHKIKSDNDNVTIDYVNYSNYDLLNVTNSYLINKCVSVKWDSNKLRLNTENTKYKTSTTDANGFINSIKFNINAKSALQYMFYKTDQTKIYNVNEFVLEPSTGC